MLQVIHKNLFHPPRFWRINVVVWLVFGLIAFLIRSVMQEDFSRALQITLATELLGFFLSGVLRRMYRHLNLLQIRRSNFIAQTLILTGFTAAFHSALLQGLITLLDLAGPTSSFSQTVPVWQRWAVFSLLMWFVYLAWSFAYLWLKAEILVQKERLQELKAKAEVQQMELQLIRFQLDPHFLFNSLNGIAAEIPAHPKIASNMVDELATYLKYSLDHRHELITPLSVELDATASYLKIQKARFGSKLQTRITAPTTTRKALVPSFILQPIVENAFKYGLGKDSARLTLLITAQMKAGHLILQVKNSGNLSSSQKSSGLGLEAVRRRLAIRYPNRHHFTLTEDNGFVVATLDLKGEPCSV
ncbi:MAG: histidine kinase [Candidatus Pacebacteria bacterium]|nr:histidine kinase [Candidatus Paceibacterota bacterium]